MGWFGKNEKAAIGIGAHGVRLLVGRGNGTIDVLYAGRAPLPEGAVRIGLRGPIFDDRAAVSAALRGLVENARAEGHLKRTPDLVALLAADGTFKMASAPIEGDSPKRADGDRMSRWILRDLLPVDESEIRADWTLRPAGEEEAANAHLLSLGGVDAVLSEYESVSEELGWTIGRLLPWSFAAGAAFQTGSDENSTQAPDRTLVFCDADGALGALLESGGRPALHRSWRSAISGDLLGAELPALRRYVNDRLETSIDAICLCGEADWVAAASGSMESDTVLHTLTPEAALRAALED
ncbi:MAG: hypothetical protein GKS06_04285 [Acidobacteria bacterium]|nr:hypothetical protein [Acidobacteriota bacterium]